MAFIYVFLGGGLGSLLRYFISLVLHSQSFYQALIPNLLGCLLIGVFSQLSFFQSDALKLLLIIGFLGGFTTFSGYVAFIGQSGVLTLNVLLYVLFNNVLGLFLYFLGAKLAS